MISYMISYSARFQMLHQIDSDANHQIDSDANHQIDSDANHQIGLTRMPITRLTRMPTTRLTRMPTTRLTRMPLSRFFILVLQRICVKFEHVCIYPPCTSHRFLSKVTKPMCRPCIRYTCISCYILGYTRIFRDIPLRSTLCVGT